MLFLKMRNPYLSTDLCFEDTEDFVLVTVYFPFLESLQKCSTKPSDSNIVYIFFIISRQNIWAFIFYTRVSFFMAQRIQKIETVLMIQTITY